MATPWLAGARPRTLPAAIAPVLVGLGAAAQHQPTNWLSAVLAVLVALALQIGVNLANDYSDGQRGTDRFRQGPQRLVASGAANAATVRRAAWLCFGLAGLAGLALSVTSGHLWLIAVGAGAIVAAWCYTGGPKPYGYIGLGEIGVFVFF
ncbi:MAG: 1,4-dihydroxy-2-naphthoate octaprenyltransferase, partial [Bifidobacteriaceae bacterium]|nr:1,4-dihydroxy-2-naphthoate octaprenyltransferase [Bifidobacteriaceae bacterium]